MDNFDCPSVKAQLASFIREPISISQKLSITSYSKTPLVLTGVLALVLDYNAFHNAAMFTKNNTEIPIEIYINIVAFTAVTIFSFGELLAGN